MPHCILEYSSNIKTEQVSHALLKRLNVYLAENFPVDLKTIKSRAVEQGIYCVSDGENNQAFIHLTVCILEGRSEELQEQLAKDLHDFLKAEFSDTLAKIPTSLTVEVKIIDKIRYVRQNFGNV